MQSPGGDEGWLLPLLFPPSEMLKGAVRSGVGTQGRVMETAQTAAQRPALPGTHPRWACGSIPPQHLMLIKRPDQNP